MKKMATQIDFCLPLKACNTVKGKIGACVFIKDLIHLISYIFESIKSTHS